MKKAQRKSWWDAVTSHQHQTLRNGHRLRSYSLPASLLMQLLSWSCISNLMPPVSNNKKRKRLSVWSGKCVISEVWELEGTAAIICSDILYYRKRSGRHRPLLRHCCPKQLLLELEQTARNCFFLKAWPKPWKHSRSLLVVTGVCLVVAEIN